MDNGHTIRTMTEDIRNTLEIDGTVPDSLLVYASTSPEGPAALNERLAIRRAETTKALLVELFPQFDPKNIRVESRANDWSGLILALRRSNHIVYKDDILKVLTDSMDVIINDELPAKTFLLIPQDIPSEAKIEVIFRRSSDNAIFTMPGLIRSNNVTRWEPGKEYIYTISTNSSNWIYHLDVLGSEQAINDDEPGKGAFKDKEGHIIVNQTVTKGAYYKVRSYRERADNLNIKEPVPWKISDISDGTTIFPQEEIGFPDQNPAISADEWIPVRVSSGDGSADYKKIDVEFCPQMTGTTHPGDWDLQSRAEYGTAESPVDLSMIYGKMNTANCYVVNGPGYFKFPLVYGNAITDGITNTGCYRYTDPGTYANKTTFPSLTSFVDYKGNAISSPGITGAADAVLVWEDAYNVISDVKLNTADGQYGTVSFKVNKKNLQQGNVVIAIRDASKVIIWSWHIWITEHWTNEGDLRLTGDVVLGAADAGYVQNNSFSVAPQNLGWCDSKNVWYLKRTGDITFTQDVSGKQVKLDVEQRFSCKIQFRLFPVCDRSTGKKHC